ncbi:MAG: chemotaxis protein CheA [Bacteroidota bacterium]|nr:chemotaxis protein CheA [Bacteroidota bacterium]
MIDRHIQAFIIEANELLTDLENSLLSLEEDTTNNELIGKIFRALHTIKGSGGMFGFDEIAMFLHDIETVYDYVRNGEMPVTKELIDLTLKAKDQIALMLEEHDGVKRTDDDLGKKIIMTFKSYVSELKKEKTEAPADVKIEHAVPGDIQRTYKVTFQPDKEIFMSGTNPIKLIEELKTLGELTYSVKTSEIPPLDTIQPELCYAGFNIIINSHSQLDDIKDVFIFVEDRCTLNIEILDETGHITNANLALISEKIDGNQELNADTINKIIKEDKQLKANNGTARHLDDKSKDEHLSSLRVSAEKLDYLVNLVSELVIVQARLSQTVTKLNNTDLYTISEEVERLTWELRDSALNIRMLPIGTTFSKFKRLVRDLSAELGKEVELTTEGAETELDKTVIERLNDPLVHIIRNSIDHGVESPDIRTKNNKPRVGNIQLSAEQSGGYVLVRIKDDGKGIDKDAVREKAISLGLISPDVELKDSELFALIFHPGFSTAKKVTNVSGRGVGMDVVRQAIETLRGNVEVDSKPGEGTVITLKLPLTLAIIDGLLVKIGSDMFVLPLSIVEECIEISKEKLNDLHGRNIIDVRGEIIPFIKLREKFDITEDSPDIQQIVIAGVKNQRLGFMVDSVVGQHQTVLKNLGKAFKDVEGISGATILGDGNVALIIDINKMAEIEEADNLKL